MIANDLEEISNRLERKEIILDFDIDFFNKSGRWAEGNIWDEKDIISFFDACTNLIKNARIITIAMSHNYSGTQEDTKYLTELVVKKIIEKL